MPALVDLSITFEDTFRELYIDVQYERWFATLVCGHAASNATLRSLELEGGTYADDALFIVLRSLTALEHLTLDQAEHSNDLFSKLSTPTQYLASLKTLKLLNLYCDVEELVYLAEFVEDRAVQLEISCFDGEP